MAALMQTYQELGISEDQAASAMRTPRSETNGGLSHGRNSAGAGGRPEVNPVVLACHLLDFWINICLCHSLIVEEAEDEGPPIFQASTLLMQKDHQTLAGHARRCAFASLLTCNLHAAGSISR